MDKHCRICHNTSCSNHGKNISFLGDGWKCNYIPVPTNADRIRAMSDEELAEFIKHIKIRAAFCKAVKDNDAFEALCSAEWLQMPAEEDDHDERKENENV